MIGSDQLLYFLNAPAWFIAHPIAGLFGFYGPARYFFTLPAAILWWCLLGSMLDSLLVSNTFRRGWFRFGVFFTLAVVLVGIGGMSATGAFRWWLQYAVVRLSDALRMMELLTPALWCVGLATVSAIGARRTLPYGHPD